MDKVNGHAKMDDLRIKQLYESGWSEWTAFLDLVEFGQF